MGLGADVKSIHATRHMGLRVFRPTAAYGVGVTPLFTVTGGKVMVRSLVGVIVHAIDAGANIIYFTSTPTVGAAIDLATHAPGTDIDGALAGVMLAYRGIGQDVWMATALEFQLIECIVQVGNINLVLGATTGAGTINWTLYYIPYEPGASVAPA